VSIRLLGINDLHGQLGDSDATVDGHAIGGVATLASYIERARASDPAGTVLVSAGDAFGASPPESSLLDHESTLSTLGAMGLNLATVGNHELDRGIDELIRLVLGDRRLRAMGRTSMSKRRRGAAPWGGTAFPWISANILDKKTGRPVFAPWTIMEVKGVKVGFIGAVTSEVTGLVSPDGIKSIRVEEPSKAINRQIRELKRRGVETIVVVIHEGGWPNKKTGELKGEGAKLVARLDPEIDVVMEAHSHMKYVRNIEGKLVVQAGQYGEALSVVDLKIDPRTGDVIDGAANLVTNDEKAIKPNAKVARLVRGYQSEVGPRLRQVISELPGAIRREANKAGESPLGALVAEAQRIHAKADIGLFNNGGLRHSLAKGKVTWGQLFAAQPYGNRLMRIEMTGAQLRDVLEQQFQDGRTVILQLAGIRARYDMRKPLGHRVVSIDTDDGTPLDLNRMYSIAVNGYLAGGGDGFTALRNGPRHDLGVDLTALVNYLRAGKPVPLTPPGNFSFVPGGEPTGYLE
jgi:5'-nucleotidase